MHHSCTSACTGLYTYKQNRSFMHEWEEKATIKSYFSLFSELIPALLTRQLATG